MEVSGQATTYTHALDLADQLRPHVIFFSFFPDALNPLAVITQLTRSTGIKVLVLKGLYEVIPATQAMERVLVASYWRKTRPSRSSLPSSRSTIETPGSTGPGPAACATMLRAGIRP